MAASASDILGGTALDALLQRTVTFARSLERALDNVGASRLPKDPEFLILVDNLSAMGSSSERLKEKLVHYMSSVKVLTRSSHGVADEFKEFYEKTPENPFTTAALKNELEMAKLDDSKFTKFSAHLEEKVMARLDLFFHYLAYLLKRVVAREKARVTFLHYKDKLAELRREHEQVLQKGKSEPAKDMERRQRNEKKFNEAKYDLEAFTVNVSNELKQAWAQRFDWINPVMTELVKTQAFFMDAISKQHAVCIPNLKAALLEHPVADGDSDVAQLYLIAKAEREAEEKSAAAASTSTDSGNGFFSNLFGWGGSTPNPVQMNIKERERARSMSVVAAPVPLDKPYDDEEGGKKEVVPGDAPAKPVKAAKSSKEAKVAEKVKVVEKVPEEVPFEDDGFEFETPAPAPAPAPKKAAKVEKKKVVAPVPEEHDEWDFDAPAPVAAAPAVQASKKKPAPVQAVVETPSEDWAFSEAAASAKPYSGGSFSADPGASSDPFADFDAQAPPPGKPAQASTNPFDSFF